MSLTERLQADMKNAMREGDAHRRDTLRMAIAAAQNAAKDKRAPLTDEEALEVVGREVKKRRESAEAYRGTRPELAAKEEQELAILQEFLPAQMSELELKAIIEAAVVASGATGPRGGPADGAARDWCATSPR